MGAMALVVIQARCGSTRLPRKVLAPVLGRPLLLRLIDRVRGAQSLDELVIATTADQSDDELAAMLTREGVAVFRGSVDDVLSRFVSILDAHPHQHVVRLTGDNPMVDAATVDLVVGEHMHDGADYTTNGLSRTFPHGLNVEVMTAEALRRIAAMDLTEPEREHVTLGILNRPDEFRLHAVSQPVDRSAWRWTVDLPEDFAWAEAVFEELYPHNPHFGQEDIVELIARRPELERTMADAA